MRSMTNSEEFQLCSEGVCAYCLQPNTESMCHICHAYMRKERSLALELARDWDYQCGPFCRFCESDEDTAPCQSMSIGSAQIRVAELVVGDTMWLPYDPKVRFHVREIEDLADGFQAGWRDLVVTRSGSRAGPRITFRWGPTRILQALRPRLCRAMACWRHRCERIEDPEVGEHAICMDHWRPEIERPG